MLTGSLFAGIAFSFARLGNVHAMSHPVSAFFNVAHGVANAVLLPVIAEYNALADHGRYLKIYNYISPIPAYEDEFEPLMLVDAIRELNEDIGIPEDLTTAIRQAKKGERCIRDRLLPLAYHSKILIVKDTQDNRKLLQNCSCKLLNVCLLYTSNAEWGECSVLEYFLSGSKI